MKGGEGRKRGLPTVGSNPMSEILKKYSDCRTDLIGGAATQTFAPGDKDPRAATEQQRRPDGRKLNVDVVVQTGDGNWAITEMLTTADV